MTETSSTVEESTRAVLVERQGHVMIVTINRPEARNAVNRAVTEGIGDALEEADADRDVWVLILTGAGDCSFCAGADLKEVAARRGPVEVDPVRSAWGFAGYVSHHISKPTIAAVNGFALGGGTEITLASDLAVAAESATFALPEVKRGIAAAAGGMFRLPAQLPAKVAMEMILTGEPISAQRALELHLVNAVVPQAQLIDEALSLAQRISANAPLSVQLSKRVARGILDGTIASEEAGWELTRKEMAVLMQSHDAKEGPLAFAEKRAPVWEGR